MDAHPHAVGRRRKLCNAAALVASGWMASLQFEVDLPNYGVFDEKRVFAPGPLPGPMSHVVASGMIIHSHCRPPRLHRPWHADPLRTYVTTSFRISRPLSRRSGRPFPMLLHYAAHSTRPGHA